LGNIIMITSCKGGVGKTTVSSLIAASLAARGKKVIAVDMDFGVRSLDIALGFENSVCADAYQLMNGECTTENAYTFDPSLPNLFFMPAPTGFDNEKLNGITQESVNGFLLSLKKEFDYVLLDMPAGFGRLFELVAASPATDRVIVVCSHSPSSVRAAEKTAFELYKLGKTEPRLIINMFNIPFVKKGFYPGILDIIERSSVRLIGVVPEDKVIDSVQQKGGLINCRTLTSDGIIAASNIASRIDGDDVSLMKSIMRASKREKLL